MKRELLCDALMAEFDNVVRQDEQRIHDDRNSRCPVAKRGPVESDSEYVQGCGVNGNHVFALRESYDS